MSWNQLSAAMGAALVDPTAPLPPGITTARGRPDASRFAVYRNNVHVGLVGALAASFPVVEKLTGPEFFRLMARAYVAEVKPVSPLLFQYGADFGDFIARFPPAADLPYLADVARLERIWLDAYQAADADPLPAQTLLAIDQDALLAVRLLPHPAARLLASDFPVASIWHGHQGDAVRPPDSWEAEIVLVTRPAHEVLLHRLTPADGRLAAALLAGLPLEEAALAAAAVDDAFDFGRSLIGLLSAGAFSACAPEHSSI